MTTVQAPPAIDADPFGHEALEDPLPLHERLREAGPVTYLTRYGVFALARYEHVRAALTDWQGFQSAAGVGLGNFRHEKPWRPPSLLLEADPPRHDAPRAVLAKVLGPRALRRLRDAWLADAERLVDDVLADTERPSAGSRPSRRSSGRPSATGRSAAPSSRTAASEALLTALARRVDRLELAGRPVRHHNNTLRAWRTLPIRVHPA